ncbi:hypothetical protein EG833_04035, partial [archaeon]|nr:hypothetical protein [archaeon]
LGISTADTGIELPTWEELFGSLDFCQCEHCNSVYGPAAYFVDLLHFLDTHGDVYDSEGRKTNRKVLDALLEKRKDLGNIRLNCANTETPMPYIDLINEILECAVVKKPDFSYQTTRTAQELKVSPENMKIEAYNTIKETVYPFDLPFDLWNVQADAYLEKIGIQRPEIMCTLQSEKGKGPSDVEIAAVHLGLTPLDLKIITGADVHDIYDFWGLKDKKFTSLKEGYNLSQLLRQTGLSYEEFSRLLDARFVNPDGKIQIIFCEEADCSLDKASVKRRVNENFETLPDEFFIRFLRFLRLNRKLGWKVGELDRALAVFSATDPDKLKDGVIIKLSVLKQLSAEFNLPVDECLSWWSDRIDTFGDEDDPSLYERVFLDRAQNIETFGLNEHKNELKL